MLPIEVQGVLTNALATGESGLYGSAMATAMKIWTQVSEKLLDTLPDSAYTVFDADQWA